VFICSSHDSADTATEAQRYVQPAAASPERAILRGGICRRQTLAIATFSASIESAGSCCMTTGGALGRSKLVLVAVDMNPGKTTGTVNQRGYLDENGGTFWI
jgi:hypothetical protein